MADEVVTGGELERTQDVVISFSSPFKRGVDVVGDSSATAPSPTHQRAFSNSHLQDLETASKSPLTLRPGSGITVGPQRFYKIESEIGRGEFGRVLRAASETGQLVAIKVVDNGGLSLRSSRGVDDDQRRKLATSGSLQQGMDPTNEIRALQLCRHANIVKLRESFSDVRHCYLVFDFAHGRSVYSILDAEESFSLPAERCRTIFRQLASAIAFCHRQNVAHRDIKLEHVLVDSQDHVTIIDFGLAFVKTSSSDKPPLDFVGTIDYCAPEVLSAASCQSKNPVDPFACDVWSMGTVLFVMLFGTLPFNRQHRLEMVSLGIHPKPEIPVDDEDDFVGPSGLLSCVLQVDPRERATAEKAVNHAWLT